MVDTSICTKCPYSESSELYDESTVRRHIVLWCDKMHTVVNDKLNPSVGSYLSCPLQDSEGAEFMISVYGKPLYATSYANMRQIVKDMDVNFSDAKKTYEQDKTQWRIEKPFGREITISQL